MKKAKLKHPFTREDARAYIRLAGQGAAVTYLRRVLAIEMVARGIRARDVAYTLHLSLNTVWNWTAEYNRLGSKFFLQVYRRGGPRIKKPSEVPAEPSLTL